MAAEDKANPSGTYDVTEARSRSPGVDNIETSKEKHGDALLGYVHQTGHVEIDEQTNKKILRKIDFNVMPWLCGLYMLQYLDKGMLSFSSVMGLLTDANLTASEYSWLGSIYYLGYMFALPIHNRLFQVFPPSRYIAVSMSLWGVVLCTMAACHDFKGLMIQRCFLGSLESVINCGFVLLTSRWYKQSEHGARVSVWASCAGVATAIGNLIAFGCLAGSERGLPMALPSWKVMALCLGAVTVVYGMCMFYFMAPSLLDAKFLSTEEKTAAAERLRANNSGIGSSEFKWNQVREAFTDIRIWLYVAFIVLTQIPAAGLIVMSSLIIKSLDFSSKESLLLNIPSGVLSVIIQIAVGVIADWTRQRSLTALGTQIFSLFGASLFIGLSNVSVLYNRPGQLTGYYIMVSTQATAYFLVLAVIASNVVGTTKKTTANVILFVFMSVAYLVGPQCFRDAPYYWTGRWITVGMWSASILVLVVIYSLNRWENARRDKWMAENGHTLPENIEFMDLTDKENMKFRYVI